MVSEKSEAEGVNGGLHPDLVIYFHFQEYLDRGGISKTAELTQKTKHTELQMLNVKLR